MSEVRLTTTCGVYPEANSSSHLLACKVIGRQSVTQSPALSRCHAKALHAQQVEPLRVYQIMTREEGPLACVKMPRYWLEMYCSIKY